MFGWLVDHIHKRRVEWRKQQLNKLFGSGEKPAYPWNHYSWAKVEFMVFGNNLIWKEERRKENDPSCG